MQPVLTRICYWRGSIADEVLVRKDGGCGDSFEGKLGGRVVDRVFHQTKDGDGRYGCLECRVEGLIRGHAIIMTCVSCFLRGERKTEGSLRRFDYDANLVEMVIRNRGSCSTRKRKSDNVNVVKDRVVRLFNS